jgi:hypothetical protein
MPHLGSGTSFNLPSSKQVHPGERSDVKARCEFVQTSRRKIKRTSIQPSPLNENSSPETPTLYTTTTLQTKEKTAHRQIPIQLSKSRYRLPRIPLLSPTTNFTYNPQTCTLLPPLPHASSTPNPKTSLYKSRIHTHCSFRPSHFTLFAASAAPTLLTGSVCAAPMLLSFTTNFW